MKKVVSVVAFESDLMYFCVMVDAKMKIVRRRDEKTVSKMNKLVEVIERERVRRGKSVEEFCVEAGLSRATWGRLVHGRGEMKVGVFLEILERWGGVIGPVVFEGDGVKVEYSLGKKKIIKSDKK